MSLPVLIELGLDQPDQRDSAASQTDAPAALGKVGQQVAKPDSSLIVSDHTLRVFVGIITQRPSLRVGLKLADSG